MKKALVCAAVLCGGASPGICSTLVGNPPIVARVVPPPGWTLTAASVHLSSVELDDCASGIEVIPVTSSLDWLVSPVYFPVGEWCAVTMTDLDIDVTASVNGNTVRWSWTGDLVAIDPDLLDVVSGTGAPVVMKIAVGSSAPTAWVSNP